MTAPQTELFADGVGAALSPRLAWLAKHGLLLFASEPENVGATSPETGDVIAAWYCSPFRALDPLHMEGFHGGDTADEACANYAKAHGLKLWNEESP